MVNSFYHTPIRKTVNSRSDIRQNMPPYSRNNRSLSNSSKTKIHEENINRDRLPTRASNSVENSPKRFKRANLNVEGNANSQPLNKI